METQNIQYRIEYFIVGDGHKPNTVLTLTTEKHGTTEQIADVLNQLKQRLRKDGLKLDDVIIYKLTRDKPLMHHGDQ